MGLVAARVLDSVHDTTIAREGDSVERQGGPRAITDQAFSPRVVIGFDTIVHAPNPLCTSNSARIGAWKRPGHGPSIRKRLSAG